MNPYRVLFAAALLLLHGAAQAQSVDWAVPIANQQLSVWSMATTPAGGVLLTGRQYEFPYGGYLRRYDAAGVMTSHQTVSGSVDSVEFTQGLAVAADSAGNTFLLGEERAGIRPRTDRRFLNKFAPDGALLWTAADVSENPYSLAVDSAGGAFLSSHPYNPSSPELARYGAGSVLWRQAMPTALLATAPGNGVFTYRASATELQIARLDSAGAPLWQTSLPPLGQSASSRTFVSNAAGDIAIVAAGVTPGARAQHRLTIFDAAGSMLAARDLDILPSYFNAAATMDSEGNVYIVGAPKNSSTFSPLLLQKYRRDGTQAWSFNVSYALPWEFSSFNYWQTGIAYDNQGGISLLGAGRLAAENANQMFLAKITTVPEPAALTLLTLATLLCGTRRFS